MPVEACATLTANILSGSRFYPYWVQLLIGGVDRNGAHVYSIDAAGGSLPDKYVSTGSGSVDQCGYIIALTGPHQVFEDPRMFRLILFSSFQDLLIAR